MRELLIAWFAFIVTLDVLPQVTNGNKRHNSVMNNTEKQLWVKRETHQLRENRADKWNNTVVNGLNDRPAYGDKIVQKNRGNSNEHPPSQTASVVYIDQTIRPRNLLHTKYIDGFKKVIRKRLKEKPRQNIEFFEDNQDASRQDEYESPRYEDVTGNDYSESSDNNANSYVTVIDNVDGKGDTDSYSTLTSDVAKNEYTNVENSIHEGANEESQMLSEEVNNLMGALTKSDSRINQVVAGEKEPLEGTQSYKQTDSTDTKVVTILDNNNNKGDYNNSQNRPVGPPADVTIIEDQEDENGDGNSHPVLSKATWNTILQVEKNLTEQDELQKEQGEHIPENPQGGISGNKTQLPVYLPLRGNASENNVNYASGRLAALESSLNIFGGSKNQSELYDNMRERTDDDHRNGNDKTLFVSGVAEEASKGYSNYTQKNHSLQYLHNMNNRTKPKPVADSFAFFHQAGKIPLQMDKSGGNNSHVKPILSEPPSSGRAFSDEHELNTSQKNYTNYQRPGDVEKLFPLSPTWRGSLVDIDIKAGTMKGGKPTGNLVDGNDHSTQHAQNANNGTQDGEIVVPSNEAYLTTDESSPLSSSAPILKIPNQVRPSNVKIIHVRPMHPEHPRKILQENRMDSSQNDGFIRKPYNFNAFQNQGFQRPVPSFVWTQRNHETKVGVPLNQEHGTSVNQANASAQMQYDKWRPGQQKAIDIASKTNGQVSIGTNSNSQQHQQRIDFQPQENEAVNTSNPAFSSWSEEYHKLVEKLRELYVKTHRSTSQATDAKSSSNPETNDLEKMMREVSRFHNLFVAQNNKQKDNKNLGGDKRMFFSGNMGEMKNGIVKNAEMTNPLDFLPFVSNRNHDNNRDASSPTNVEASPLHITKDVTGQVRSIEEPIKPLVSETNASDLSQKGMTFFDSSVNANNTRQPNASSNLTLDNQSLASNQNIANGTNLRDASGEAASADGGQSSHQVLMTYFRNETVLRKQLQNITDILRMNGFAVGEVTERKTAKEDSLDNSTSTTVSESTGSQEKLSSNGGNVTGKVTNDYVLPWPSQVKNVSIEAEEGSLAKYIEDFISMLSPNNGTTTRDSNETGGGLSNSSFKPNTETATPSDTLKKENVTGFNNRVIIVVSPKSLKDLMKNRSHSSSMLVVNKVPQEPGEVKNSTANVKSKVKNTTKDFHEHPKSLHNKAAIGNQISNESTKLDIQITNSGKETAEPESKEADLKLLHREELKSLEVSLSRDFMSSWIYYQRSLDEMGISPSMLRSGIANLGSSQRLKRVFRRALSGADIHVLVVGGSISAGGGIEKDRGNVEGVYHKALSDWWNHTVTPITASQLKIDAVAIGGTDSEYFSYCVKNYMRTLPDIVIWELAANDYQRYKGRSFAPAKPLEQLTRIILSLPSHPALILANFFRGNYYRTAVGQDCPDSEDEGGKTIAQYYKLTSLSWRNVICSSIADQEMDLKKLFSSDGYHPSLLGHAQMSSLLISYLKGVFEQTISKEMVLSRNHTLQSHQQDQELTTLPKPIFDDPENPKPFCWTLLTPDYQKKLRNTLPDLEFTEATGFQFANVSHWPIRRDRLRCLKAMEAGAMLKMRFIVPLYNDLDDSEDRSERELAITTHNSFGGMGAIWVDGNRQSAKVIKEEGGQRRTQVNVLTRTLAPGPHIVTVSALQPGFCLSAVAVL